MAAGQGFKTFTTGEVLTAADVNGYLMQGVLVFASAAARDAAITSPQEGQFAYTKDNNSLWYYTGSAWAASGATGDIEGVTAGTALTGGGTSGTVTLNFDVANYGGGQWAAGKNKIINGDFGIWQRGTSFSANAFNSDRWKCGSDATITISRQTFTPGTAPVAGYEGQYFCRLSRSAGGSYLTQAQPIENVQTFAGQTVVLSFWAKASTAVTLEPYYEQVFGSGGSGTVGGALGSSQAITTSWARYSFTTTLPSISGKTIGTSSNLNIFVGRYIGAAAVDIDLWGVQLEAGSTATPFQTATGTPQGELAACQRYYYRLTATQAYSDFGAGYNANTTNASYMVPFPATMRTTPTAMEQTGTASDYNILHSSGGSPARAVCSAVPSYQVATPTNCRVYFTVASGLTAGNGSIGGSNNNTNAYLGWSAEL